MTDATSNGGSASQKVPSTPAGSIYSPPSRAFIKTDLIGADTASSALPQKLPPQRAQIPAWLSRLGMASWYLVGIGVVVYAVVAGTLSITPVFIAVFVALVFTSLLNPLVNALDKHMSRWLAVILALLGAILVFSGLIAFVVTSVAGQWHSLTKQLANGTDKIIEFIESTPFHVSLTSDEVYNWFEELVRKGQLYATDNWQRLVGEVLSNAGTIAIFFTILALSVFVTIFFLHSGATMWRWFLNLLPTRARATTNHAAEAGWLSFSGYARGTVIISLIDGILASIYLTVVGVPLAPALGVLVMIGAFIPMVGAPAAMIIAMIVALAVDGVWKAVIVGIGIALIGQLEGHVLQPLIMGKQVSLHPVVVGIGVVSGTLLGGLIGAIIVVPIMGVTWAVFSSLYHRDPPIVGKLPGAIEVQPAPRPKNFLMRLVPSFFRPKKAAPSSTKIS